MKGYEIAELLKQYGDVEGVKVYHRTTGKFINKNSGLRPLLPLVDLYEKEFDDSFFKSDSMTARWKNYAYSINENSYTYNSQTSEIISSGGKIQIGKTGIKIDNIVEKAKETRRNRSKEYAENSTYATAF